MSPPDAEIVGLFTALECNRRREVAEAKAKFAEMLNSVKDGWLVAGFVNYYLSTGSVRVVDVVAKAPVPHDRHLFEKLGEGLRGSWRIGALEMLGHVVRRQPLWLHKIARYPVFRELLGVLRTEREIVPLLSGLLLLITLLPMIPTLVGPFFPEIFDVFARLAAWESSKTADSDGEKEHLQLALYSLFQNLYGMFPCNFVDFLRREYSKRENGEVFTHTVRPMLESVRVHPLLVTASKAAETDAARWKKMEHHDVLVECRRFSSESARRQPDDGRFRSRCGTDVSALAAAAPPSFRAAGASGSAPNLAPTLARIGRIDDVEPGGERWFSLSEACDASSTPSAPQTPLPISCAPPQTPGSLPTPGERRDGGSPPEAAVEATPENTPMKDSRRRFDFPTNSPVVRALGGRLGQPQGAAPPSLSQPPSPMKADFGRTPLGEGAQQGATGDSFYAQSRLTRVLGDRSRQADGPSASPQKRAPDSPVPAGGAPVEWPPVPRARRDEDDDDDGDRRPADPDENWAEEEAACEGEDPRCRDRRHGLHMPHSASMLGMFRRATRNRFHSQCAASNGPAARAGRAPCAGELRRASSCPELEVEERREPRAEGAPREGEARRRADGRRSEETQTVDVWPTVYEHMFADALRSACDEGRLGEARDGDASPHRQVDRYVEAVAEGRRAVDGDVERALRRQIQLLQLELQYERHRREVHAVRNRRLLGRSRKNRAAEEQNQALRERADSLRAEVEALEKQHARHRQAAAAADRKLQDCTKHWVARLARGEAELAAERLERERLASLLLERRATPSDADVQHLKAELFDCRQQLQRANRKAEVGDRQIEAIKRFQRELIICGENEAKHRELLSALPSRTDAFAGKVAQQLKEQLAAAQALLQAQTSRLEYLVAREAELEAAAAGRDAAAQDLKKQLRLVKEEYSEKLKSVEDKYQSVKRINQRLEAHCLELLQRVPQSPQTLSRDLTSGFSPQSSPLSASLASSEGHGAALSARVDEMRNLQDIVNAHETIEESTSNSVNSAAFEDDVR